MKHVIRYLLEGDGTVPVFVVDGGYFVVSDEMVGISVDDAKRHLPSTVQKLTRAELLSRIEAICLDSERNPVSPEIAEQIASELLEKHDMADYE